MIISHKYQFVFIKTRRTAGSSIEAALYPFLGPDDVCTGSERDGTPRQNVHNKFLTGHIGWDRIERYFPGCESYRRLCVERNPWDKQASEYRYKRAIGEIEEGETFFQFTNRHTVSDWGRYTVPVDNEFIGRSVVAAVMQYETVHADFLAEFVHGLGLPRCKAADLFYGLTLKQTRDENTPPLAQFYRDNPGTLGLVRMKYASEIQYFGYEEPR